ncbi:RNA helicase [Irineochytrium annulatum]|nr:RNA helicase [Irineochytrium annulatum]
MLRAGLLTCRLPSTAAWSLVLSSTRSLHASAPSYSLSNTKTSASSSWTFKTRYPRNNKLKGKGVGGKGAKGNGVKGKPPGKRKQWIAEASKGITGLALPARLRLSPMRPRAPGRDGKNNGDSTGALVASRSGAARDRPAWRAGGAGPYETVGRNGGGRAPANGRMGSPVESRSRWGQPVSTSRFNGLQRKAAVDSLDVPAGSPPSRYQGLERGPAPRVKVSRKDRRAMRDRGARAATGGRRSSGFTAKAETGARVPTGGRAIVAARQLAESQEKTAAIQASRRERAEKFAMDNVDVSPATKKEMMKTVAKVHFKTMPLRLEVLEAVKNALGPDCKPTPAQALGIPASLDPRRERRPILLGAETGSGKTLAYLIPMIQRLREQEAREAEEILTSDDPDGVIDAVIASATSHFVKPESFLVPTEGGASALAVRSRQHPTFSSSKLRKPRRPRAVILVPTRDLITQVAAVAKKLCAHHARLTVLGLQPFVKDLAAMEERIRWQPVDIVVTTPHNLVRLLEGDGRLTLMPDNIGEIVVDEADTIMDDSFRAEMDRLMGKLSQLPQQPLMTWCSATFPASMIKTISQENPDHIRITTPSLHRTVAGLKQHFVRVSGSDTKANLLMDVLSRSGMGGDKRVIVFCKRRETAEWLADYLRGKKIASVGLITARTWQEERDGYVAAFCGSGRDAAGATSEEGSGVHDDVPRRGISAGVDELRVLVATDVASRGLDTTVVDHVINYDFPQTVMEYLHRVGRTARNGAKGRATSFVTKKEMTLALAIERAGKYGAVLA